MSRTALIMVALIAALALPGLANADLPISEIDDESAQDYALYQAPTPDPPADDSAEDDDDAGVEDIVELIREQIFIVELRRRTGLSISSSKQRRRGGKKAKAERPFAEIMRTVIIETTETVETVEGFDPDAGVLSYDSVVPRNEALRCAQGATCY